jgi:SAM-dependent methyltransferase
MRNDRLDTVYRAEREKWNRRAPGEVTAEHLAADATSFEQSIGRSVMMPGVASFLGDLAGRQVLEYGCGMGHYTVLLAKTGAWVTSFDLSDASVAFTRKRLAAHGLHDRVRTAVAAAEDLPFRSEQFDVVFGRAILHHIDPSLGPRELHRVLRRGGRAAFAEPLGMNPVLNFVREHVPYPHKTPRGSDVPWRREHMRAWTAGYREVQVQGVHLLSMVERGFGFHTELPTLRRLDRALLRRFPVLLSMCRYAAVCLVK